MASPRKSRLNPDAPVFTMSTMSRLSPPQSKAATTSWMKQGTLEIDKLTRIEENIDEIDAGLQELRTKGDAMTPSDKKHFMVLKNVKKNLRHARSRLLASIVKAGRGGQKKTKKNTGAKAKKAHAKSRRH